MKQLIKSLSRLIILIGLLLPTFGVGMDNYGPRPFSQILESDYTSTWTPTEVNPENRDYVVILNNEQSSYLSINLSDDSALSLSEASVIISGSGTYGDVMRGMFQLQDLNIEELFTETLSGAYTIRPVLGIYYALDANADVGASTSSGLVIRDIKSTFMTGQTTIAYLGFEISTTGNSTVLKASSRYQYDLSTESFEIDNSWSSNHWVDLSSGSIELTTTESNASSLLLADATDLINVKNEAGSAFNPGSIDWQTNSFASWPINPATGEASIEGVALSQLYNLVIQQTDIQFQMQFGHSDEATAVAEDFLNNIESTLQAQGESLRYDKSLYLAVRENMLSHRTAAVDEVNCVLDTPLIAHVYFTNAQDDDGVYHPFMVVGAHNGTGGPNFLIDVPRPPGDGSSGEYSDQTITRNAVVAATLFKIPLKDYGLITNLTDNDMSPYNSIALDANLPEDEWNVYNHSSISANGIAVDGVKVYPAYNNTLTFAQMNAEITSTGAHVGRGMGLHYHADGHAFSGNGINLYNLDDYTGHTHPPIIAFSFDGLALYGKYESSHATMDGYETSLDEFGSHSHDDYGHHYHAFTSIVSDEWANQTFTFEEHFLLAGAYRGLINDIPGFQNFNTNQLVDEELGKYVGAEGTYTNIDEGNIISKDFTLYNAYPNPFNPVTTIHYELSKDLDVKISVLDLNGKYVKQLVHGSQNAGIKSVLWNGTDNAGLKVGSGIYFYRIQLNRHSETKKMILLK